jgi:hypothetical protein
MERVVIRAVIALSAFAAIASAAGLARAAEPKAPLWTIEAEPWPCARFVEALAREVELACDASGSACHVAAVKDTPTMRAVLVCAADASKPWTVSATTIDGDEIWTLTLEGDLEERLRKGALWIARTPVPEPAAPPPVVRSSPPPSAPPAAEAPEPPPAPEVEPPPAENGGLTLEAFYRVGGQRTQATGARGAGFLHGTGLTRLGLSVAVANESSVNQTSTDNGYWITTSSVSGWTAEAGAIFTVGAPWSDHVGGIALEAGVAAGTRSGEKTSCGQVSCTGAPTGGWVTESFASPYLSGAAVLQIPTHLPLGTWTSAKLTWDPLYYGTSQFFFTFSVGFSWRAW